MAEPGYVTNGQVSVHDEYATSSEHESPCLLHDSGKEEDSIRPLQKSSTDESRCRYSQTRDSASRAARSLERAATSAFVLGKRGVPQYYDRSASLSKQSAVKTSDLPQLSRQVTIGRNSNFYNLTEDDRERLGGIEYRALRLLLKFVSGMFL